MLPNTCFLTQYRCLTSSPASMQGIPTAAHDVLCAQLRWVSAADHITAWFTSQTLRTRTALIQNCLLRCQYFLATFQYIDCTNYIGIVLIAAVYALK